MPWPWLNSHSAALQAIGAIIGSLFTFLTLPVLFLTWRAASSAAAAAREQAEAARAQVKAANESSRVAEAQLVAAQEAARAERAHSDIMRLQLLESLRPILVLTRRTPEVYRVPGDVFALENTGAGVAFDVSVYHGVITPGGDDLGLLYRTIGPGDAAPLRNFVIQKLGEKFSASYRSSDGRRFFLEVTVGDNYTLEQKITELSDAPNREGESL